MIDLETVLLDLGVTPDKVYPCSVCGRETAPFAISVTGPEAVTVTETVRISLEPSPDPEKEMEEIEIPVTTVELDGAICTGCIVDNNRKQKRIKEEKELKEKAPWDKPQGVELRMERNRRIEAVRWAIDPLTSPLTKANQAAFVQYVKKLNKLTLDFSSPEEVVWPTEPTPEY